MILLHVTGSFFTGSYYLVLCIFLTKSLVQFSQFFRDTAPRYRLFLYRQFYEFVLGLPKPGSRSSVLVQGEVKCSLDDHTFGHAIADAWQLVNRLHGGPLTPPVPQEGAWYGFAPAVSRRDTFVILKSGSFYIS